MLFPLPPQPCRLQMESEEYGEALELARRYGLDCNRVYQHQWAESQPFTAAAISDYLVSVLATTAQVHEVASASVGGVVFNVRL